MEPNEIQGFEPVEGPIYDEAQELEEESTTTLEAELEELATLGELLDTIQARNSKAIQQKMFEDFAASATGATKAIVSYTKKSAPWYVNVTVKDKTTRRAANKKARKSRKKNRG